MPLTNSTGAAAHQISSPWSCCAVFEDETAPGDLSARALWKDQLPRARSSTTATIESRHYDRSDASLRRTVRLVVGSPAGRRSGSSKHIARSDHNASLSDLVAVASCDMIGAHIPATSSSSALEGMRASPNPVRGEICRQIKKLHFGADSFPSEAAFASPQRCFIRHPRMRKLPHKNLNVRVNELNQPPLL